MNTTTHLWSVSINGTTIDCGRASSEIAAISEAKSAAAGQPAAKIRVWAE